MNIFNKIYGNVTDKIRDSIISYIDIIYPPITDSLLVWLLGDNTNDIQKKDSWAKPYRENFDVLQSSCCSVNGVDEELVFSFALPGDATITYQGTATAVLDVPNNKITFSSAGTFYDLRVFTEA